MPHTSDPPFPARELVPHEPPMLLVDRIVGQSGSSITGEHTVQPDGLFFQPGRGLPAYAGFEIMAQTVSAFDGLRRIAAGETPQLGFLLGCRKYAASVDWFPAGQVLRCEATALLDEGEMRSFDCRLTDTAGNLLASGVLSVYRPENPDLFLRTA
jgi:predicted hotdog family 3-hydroxylacyl-ACP dehydratase